MKWLESFWHWLNNGSGVAVWATGVLVILCITSLVHIVWRSIHRRVHRRLERTTTVWDDAVWEALSRPVGVALWLIGVGLSVEHAFGEANKIVAKVVSNGRDIGLVLLIGWFLLRLVRSAVDRLMEQSRTSSTENRLDITTIDAIGKLLRISVVVVMALVLLQTMGFSISGVLAFGGIGGLAVSFAAKDLLANFFGGLIIYLDRPFAVGDYVRSPDREMEGTVEYVGWRQTRIRTPDKRALYLPNSIFANIAVENISRQSHRRIKELIGLRYQDADKLPALLADLRAMLAAHPQLDPQQEPEVFLTQFGDSTLNIQLQAHTRPIDAASFNRAKEHLLLQTLELIHRHGADCAFPTRTVLVSNELAAAEAGKSDTPSTAAAAAGA